MDYDKFLKNKLENFIADDLERKQVSSILEKYGVEKHEQEPSRVRLAILKLSGPDVSEVEKWTKYAKQDYRDILTWAEYPRQSRKSSMPDGPKKQKLVEADIKEYQQWLNT